MRRFVPKIVIFLALIWGGWWWVGTGGLQRGVQSWLGTLPAQGMNAQVAQWQRGGFPMRLATTATDIQWVDEKRATTTHVPAATLSTPIYWPGDARIEIPAGTTRITTPHADLAIATDGAEAEMLLHQNQALQLEALSAKASGVSVSLPDGNIAGVDTLQAHIQQASDPATYTIDLTAFGFALGAVLTDGLDLPDQWPATFEPIIADMTVQFDRPWDRSALQIRRPQPRDITIEKLEVVYGDLGISVQGRLTVDEAGAPSGLLTFNLRNWQQIFDILAATSNIPAQWRGTVEQLLGAMAQEDGSLDLDITLAQGQMRLGFFPLGPAPRLIIR